MIFIDDGKYNEIIAAENIGITEYSNRIMISAKMMGKTKLDYHFDITADAIIAGKVDIRNHDKIKKVIFHDPATIVYWVDGTKTVVKRNKKDKKFDKEKGLAMAICKKYFCSYVDMKRIVEKYSQEENKNE